MVRHCTVKRPRRMAAVAALLLAITVLFSITPTFARYNNVAVTSAIYQQGEPSAQTLRAEKPIYDFGCWRAGADDEFAHTVRMKDTAPLAGVLRFTFDAVTAEEKKVAVHIEAQHYTAVNAVGTAYTDYTIHCADGQMAIPFSLIFSAPQRAGVVTLDVAWIPDGASAATRSARYLLALNPEGTSAEDGADYFSEGTGFITNDLLQLSLRVPSACAGLLVSPGATVANTFAADTRYYTDAYPQGITLLRDSALYLPRGEGDTLRALLDVSALTADNTTAAVGITAGVSEASCASTSQTPTADIAPITVSLSDPAGIVSSLSPLTVTLTEPSHLRDGDWSTAAGAGNQLTWQLERRVGERYVAITENQDLAVTVRQTDGGGTVTIAAPTGKQPAGTYRLTVSQTYTGYQIAHTPIWFFIDYR